MVPVRFLYSTYLSPKKLMRNFSSPVKGGFWLVIYFLYLSYTCEPEVRERQMEDFFLSFCVFFSFNKKEAYLECVNERISTTRECNQADKFCCQSEIGFQLPSRRSQSNSDAGKSSRSRE